MPYPVFDLQCDTADRLAWQTLPASLRRTLGSDFYGPEDARDPSGFRELARNEGALSLERIGTTPWAQCFACFIPDALSPSEAAEFFSQVSSYLLDQVQRNAERVVQPGHAAELHDALGTGRVVAVRTIENARLFAHDPSLVAQLADEGVLMASLSWNAQGPLASGCDAEGIGFTEAGRAAVRLMEEERMVLDVSHLNDACFWEAARIVVDAMSPYAGSDDSPSRFGDSDVIAYPK